MLKLCKNCVSGEYEMPISILDEALTRIFAYNEG